jgi:hypothetical protein
LQIGDWRLETAERSEVRLLPEPDCKGIKTRWRDCKLQIGD